MDEAFKLRGQHQEHHQQRQGEGHVKRAGAFTEFQALPQIGNARFLRQHFLGGAIKEIQSLAQGITRRERGGDGNGAHAVLPRQGLRAGAFGKRHHIGKRHQPAGSRAHKDILQIIRRNPRGIRCLQQHLIFLPTHNIGGDFA